MWLDVNEGEGFMRKKWINVAYDDENMENIGGDSRISMRHKKSLR